MSNGRVSWQVLIVVAAAAACIGGVLLWGRHGADDREPKDTKTVAPLDDEAAGAQEQPATGPALPKGWTSEKRRVKVATPDGETQREITYYKNRVGMEFVFIPAGKFKMGSDAGRPREKPVHEVEITNPFYMGATEITQAQWKTVMGTEPWRGKWCNGWATDAPACYVSWDDAQEFCRKLNAEMGDQVRLPTEAEWEYACRAGSTTAFYFGDDARKLRRYAWCYYPGRSEKELYPHRVAQKTPNAWGLYDMHGNVAEWCEDRFRMGDYRDTAAVDADSADARNESATGDVFCTVRGGAWFGPPDTCGSASRMVGEPTYGGFSEGFRVAVLAP
jgi:formylglycine-generating enzyme required for sulfatase activity